MPVFIGDYLADTIGLTLSQHGAYFLLMMAYWKNRGPLPDAEAKAVIRDACATDARRIQKYFRIASGFWHHKRIDAELLRAKENSESRKSAAKTASLARWSSKKGYKNGHPSRMPDAYRDASVTHVPSPSPSPSDKGTSDKAYKGKTAKLNRKARELANRLEGCLNGQWDNDAGKWVNRIKSNLGKSERVVAEVESAVKENRITETPAQYAEHIWKEFAP